MASSLERQISVLGGRRFEQAAFILSAGPLGESSLLCPRLTSRFRFDDGAFDLNAAIAIAGAQARQLYYGEVLHWSVFHGFRCCLHLLRHWPAIAQNSG